MTVAELITKLLTMPPELGVCFAEEEANHLCDLRSAELSVEPVYGPSAYERAPYGTDLATLGDDMHVRPLSGTRTVVVLR